MPLRIWSVLLFVSFQRHNTSRAVGYDSEAEINVVWVYISSLRKKLAQIGSTVEIKASRGLGYTLEKAD